MDKVVSMQDIAEVAGVSLSTVSRALADNPRVKLATRQRIQRLANDLGYLPNAIARGLATNRTNTIGVVVRDIADPFIAEFVRTVDKTALDRGYSVTLSNCDADPQRELTAINGLRQKRVDGIIVPDIVVGPDSIPLLEQIGVPVILINQKNYRYSVSTDNITAARQGVNHLLDLGHNRIAYISSSRNRDDSLERQTGYEQALESSGVSLDPALIVKGNHDASKGGQQAFEYLFSLPQPPTAIFCFDDMTAMGVINAAYTAGVGVPDQLSVLGFDDIDLAGYLTPPLTTISQQKEKMARITVEMLLDVLDGKEFPANVVLPGELIIRDSTTPPGR